MTAKEKHSLKIAQVFRQEGYNGASMSRIAEATGLQKGSLYHHYPNGKVDMATAALQAIGEEYKSATKSAFQPNIPIRKQLEAWAEGINRFYSKGKSNCILGAMTMSGGKSECGDMLKEAFQNWISSLTIILESTGIDKTIASHRAFEAIERIQGALIVARALDDTSNFDRLIKQLPDILLDNTKH